MSIKKQHFELKCPDGVYLSALLVLPDNPIGSLLFNGAMAVPKEFYLEMADFFARKNYTCLLFDYRGIAGSRPKEGLKGCEFELTDWATQDISSGISHLKGLSPELPLYLICHSVGGQIVGLVPNINTISGMLAIATSSGFYGNFSRKNKIQAFFLFDIIRPISQFLYGYAKFKPLGIMEDLPKNIINKWRKWCSKESYLFDEENFKELKDQQKYSKLNFPIYVFSASDDAMSNAANVRAFWKHIKSFRGIKHQLLRPKDFGIKTIGHFNFFRKTYGSFFWPMALDRLESFGK